jgi:hypothetical protein
MTDQTDKPAKPHVRGVSRDAADRRSIVAYLSAPPTDDELRDFHNYIRSWGQGGVTFAFMAASAKAAIRALRDLEQTAIMLEKWAPEVFPETNEVNGVIQKHFGRVMMESAAEAIRQAWAGAIAEIEKTP